MAVTTLHTLQKVGEKRKKLLVELLMTSWSEEENTIQLTCMTIAQKASVSKTVSQYKVIFA